MGNVQDSEATPSQPQTAPIRPPRPAPPPPIANPYPNLQDDDHDYEILLPSYPRPNKPAPFPTSTSQVNTNTINVSNTYNAMEGVPFVINPSFSTSANATKVRSSNSDEKHLINRKYLYYICMCNNHSSKIVCVCRLLCPPLRPSQCNNY